MTEPKPIRPYKRAHQELLIRDESGKVITDPNMNPKTTEDIPTNL